MRKRKSYHHGNLRETLLQAAIQLIGEVGPGGFTLREVARRAGVSHNAPYRHFQDKEELLAAVATEGYRGLKEAMLDAAKGQSDPVDRLKRAGLAYVQFALRLPEHFTVMFEVPIAKNKDPNFAQASEEAFMTLMSFVTVCQQERRLPPGDPQQFAMLAWSMVHGVAKLATAGRLPSNAKADVLKFAQFVMDQSLPEQSRQR
jgi:AcrR family transcriptional regulator